MTAKGKEKNIADLIIKKLKSASIQKKLGFYTSNESEICRFQGEPELDILITNCRLFNGIPMDVNIEIFDKKCNISARSVKHKYTNHKDSVLILCLNKGEHNNTKYDGYVYSAFSINSNKTFSVFYKSNPYVMNVIERVGQGDEKIGIRNLTCLNDIINSNVPKRAKRNALYFLGELLTGYEFFGKKLRHCFFEPSLSLVRMILTDEEGCKKYMNVFLKNTNYSKSQLDKILVSKLNNPKIANDEYYLLVDKNAKIEEFNIADYITGYVRVASSKNYTAKGRPILEVRKF